MAIGEKVGLHKWFIVMQVRVECQEKRRPFLNDSNARVAMTVDTPFVSLRQAEPAFQFQVVFSVFEITTYEQPRPKAGHDLDHMLAHRIRLGGKCLYQTIEALLPFSRGPVCRRQGMRHDPDVLDMVADMLLHRLYGGQPPAKALL